LKGHNLMSKSRPSPESEPDPHQQGKTGAPGGRAVGVYDRPKRSGPSKMLILIIAVAAIVILLVVLLNVGVLGAALNQATAAPA
jgi:hypothetical protein